MCDIKKKDKSRAGFTAKKYSGRTSGLVVQGDSFRVRAGVGLLADTSYTRTDIRLSEPSDDLLDFYSQP